MSHTGEKTRATIIVIVLLSALFSGASSGLHEVSDAVGPGSLGPVTVYLSHHEAEETEEHLHAVAGVDSRLCLACFLSLRHKTALEAAPALFSLADSAERTFATVSPAPRDAAPRLASSRAPPRA